MNPAVLHSFRCSREEDRAPSRVGWLWKLWGALVGRSGGGWAAGREWRGLAKRESRPYTPEAEGPSPECSGPWGGGFAHPEPQGDSLSVTTKCVISTWGVG